MSRVILLLPDPDVLQLANCHKYVTRRQDTYSEIYTLTTIGGKCANADKILVIGHGKQGALHSATTDRVADAIFGSGISLTGNKKVAFDNCYAGYKDNTTTVKSALYKVGERLKGKNNACNLELVGATGCTVTIGELGYSLPIFGLGRVDLSFFGGKPDKRLVVDESKYSHASGSCSPRCRRLTK